MQQYTQYRQKGGKSPFKPWLNQQLHDRLLSRHPTGPESLPGSGLESEGLGFLDVLAAVYGVAVGAATATEKAIELVVEQIVDDLGDSIQVLPAGSFPEPAPDAPTDGGSPPPLGVDGDDGQTGGGGGGCFVAGTRVLLEGGDYRNIENVRINDTVVAADEGSARQGPEVVTKVWVHRDEPLRHLVLDSGEIVTTTSRHRFFVDGHGFTALERLRVGDPLRTADGSLVHVRAISDDGQRGTVFNLSVAHAHTYFVGESRLWVHNVKDDGSNVGEDDGDGTGGGGEVDELEMKKIKPPKKPPT